MKKINLGIFLTIYLLLGITIGIFFGLYRATIATDALIVATANTPASPVTINSDYNENKGELHLAILNTGVMPLKLINKTIFITPKSGKNISLGLNIPLNTIINGGELLEFNVKLNKQQNDNYKVGDLITTSIDYIYPISNDIYNMTHVFEKSETKNTKGNNINNKGDNQNLQKKYKENLKTQNK